MKIRYDLDTDTFTVMFHGLTRDDLEAFLVHRGVPKKRVDELADLAKATPLTDPEIVEKLIDENCRRCDGSKITFAEFFDRLAPVGWSRYRLSKNLPLPHRTVDGTSNATFIPGLTWLSAEID